MKKTLLTSLFVLTAILSYSIPIIGVTQQCGGLLGYSYVEWHREVYDTDADGTKHFGWVGDCNGRGFNKCKPPIANTDLNGDLDPIEADYYDHAVAQDLITQIIPTIDDNNTSGSITSTMSVQGQSFKRVYTLTWDAVPAVCQDENGSQVSSYSTTYNCSVEYVQF